MKPVTQTILGENGNCFEACLASILECDLGEIPYFGAYDTNEGLAWGRAVNAWLKGRGLQYLEVSPGSNFLWEYVDTYHLLIGPTERSTTIYHAVVAKSGKEVHDPHPDKVGLLKADRSNRIGVLVFTGEKD